ncbi:hypothetical protein FACS189443_2290 [Planctomycetales bacterium]|nr:hypothetical protein FACS189443_2290 [Planctomycetales bacterium]
MTKRTFSFLTIALSFVFLTAYGAENGVVIDQNTSIEVLRTEAERNNPVAQHGLGERYYNGDGIAQDKAEAVKWFQKAAEQRFAPAEYNLGVCYANGDGIAQDKAEAVKWYRKAAEQGLALAQNNLGACYLTGDGIAQDKAEAVKWYRKAAEQGLALAQNNLGACYLTGDGIAQDKAEAVKWFRKAAEQGFAPAKKDSESAQKPRMADVKDEFSMVLIYITGICTVLIPYLVILVLLIQNNKLKNASLTILHRIALYQRRINLGILLMFFGIGLIATLVMGTWLCHLSEQQQIVIVGQVGAILFCVYIYYVIWMLSAIYSLADSLNVSGCLILVLWFLLAPTPGINLLILMWMSRKATKTLTAAGYKVGFLGASMRQFQPTEMYQPEPIEPPQP